MLPALLDNFFKDAQKLLNNARKGLDEKQPEEVRRAAHTLKSNAKNFGANALGEVCQALETCARDGKLDGAADLLGKVEMEYERARGMRAVHETAIASRILARVLEVNLKAGQAVKKDQVLLRLDDADLRARLQQAKAALTSAEAAHAQADERFLVMQEGMPIGVLPQFHFLSRKEQRRKVRLLFGMERKAWNEEFTSNSSAGRKSAAGCDSEAIAQ